MMYKWSAVALLVLACACGDSDDKQPEDTDTGGDSDTGNGDTTPPPASDDTSQRAALDQAIAATDTATAFTLILGNDEGTFYAGSHGSSTADTVYESASTSKLVAAVVIMHVVETGALSLDDHPQDHINFWTSDTADLRSHITLRQLLAFTSGVQIQGDAKCTSNPLTGFVGCVQNIYDEAAGLETEPGTEFIYGQNHLQVAGLMAIRASGAADWETLFNQFKTATGLFAHSAFDLPSPSNPRLAGGMHWTGNDYMQMLRALANGTLLSDATRQTMFADNTQNGVVTIVATPAVGIGEEWHYAQGNWRECPFATWQASCDTLSRISSPGAYGAYPFIDFTQHFYGILAREGGLGTFPEGYQIYKAMMPQVNALVEAQ